MYTMYPGTQRALKVLLFLLIFSCFVSPSSTQRSFTYYSNIIVTVYFIGSRVCLKNYTGILT